MGSCCGKREPAKTTTANTAVTQGNPGGISSNEVPKLAEFAAKFFEQSNFIFNLNESLDRDNRLIVLSLSKD